MVQARIGPVAFVMTVACGLWSCVCLLSKFPTTLAPTPAPLLQRWAPGGNRSSITRVVVPSVYREWVRGKPDWATDTAIQSQYEFSTFVYQKLDPEVPNYIAKNRGTEAGVYLRFIVDFYEDFPDLAFFTHADPQAHAGPDWKDKVRCMKKETRYFSLNSNYVCRDPMWWTGIEVWIEQCWRDVLGAAWDVNATELAARAPYDQPLRACMICCQQFAMSREQVHSKPLQTWRKLLQIVALQDVCHVGDPDYDHLYATEVLTYRQAHLGPETPSLDAGGYSESKSGGGYGQHTQGGAMEHLAHVVFGDMPLDLPEPTEDDLCRVYEPSHFCPGSPCIGVAS